MSLRHRGSNPGIPVGNWDKNGSDKWAVPNRPAPMNALSVEHKCFPDTPVALHGSAEIRPAVLSSFERLVSEQSRQVQNRTGRREQGHWVRIRHVSHSGQKLRIAYRQRKG